MGTDILFLVFLFLPATENINLKLEGLIDLGPKWNFVYSLIPLRENLETEATRPVVLIKNYGTETTRPVVLIKSHVTETTRPVVPIKSHVTETTRPVVLIKSHVTEPTSPPATKTSQSKTSWSKTTPVSKPPKMTQYYADRPKRKNKKRKHRENKSHRNTQYDVPRERITKFDTYDSYTKTTKTEKNAETVKLKKITEKPSKSKRIKEQKTSKDDLTETPATTQANDLRFPKNPDQNASDTKTSKNEENTETAKSKKVTKKPSESKRKRKQKTSKDDLTERPTTTQANDLRFPKNPNQNDSNTNTTKKENTETVKSIKVTKKPSKSKHSKTKKDDQTKSLMTTQANHLRQTKYFVAELNNSRNYDKIHKVKDDNRLTDFTVHILRQSLQVFDTIKNKVDDEKIKSKIDSLSRHYKEKFTDFVLDTRNQSVKTRLGTKKVVLNTIGTSQRIMNRLLNYLTGDLNKKGLRYDGLENVIHSEVNKEIEMEYQHACTKFGICRSSDGFQKFLMDVMTEVIKNDDKKLRKVNDVLTDVVKNADFRNIVDSRIQKKFDKSIRSFETMDTKLIRHTYTMYRNAIGARDKPIAVMEGVDAQTINKTVAFLDLIDILDANIKPTETNVRIWNKIKHNLSLWTVGTTKDIRSTVELLINHIADETNIFDAATVDSLNAQLKCMLRAENSYKYDYF